jgi:ppGpp synthetase/RelA/SpoT-type nucleotidyltranferase
MTVENPPAIPDESDESGTADDFKSTASFLQEYEQKWPSYSELARKAKDLFENNTRTRDLSPPPFCTARAKNLESVKRKILRRDSTDWDRSDLAGIRIHIYFPSHADAVEQTIYQIFDDVQRKVPSPFHPGDCVYNARIYRLKIKDIDMAHLNLTIGHNVVEVQVVSVLMHAWAEVEHKRYQGIIGDSTAEEDRVLKELNDVVLAGEAKLVELHRLYESRKARS